MLPLPLPCLLGLAPESLSHPCRKLWCNQPIFVSEKPIYSYIGYIGIKPYCDCSDTWSKIWYPTIYILIGPLLHLICLFWIYHHFQTHSSTLWDLWFLRNCCADLLIYKRIAGTGSRDTWDLHHELSFFCLICGLHMLIFVAERFDAWFFFPRRCWEPPDGGLSW